VQSRRELLKRTAILGAGLATYGIWRPREAHAFSQSDNLQLWRTTLRGIVTNQIPVAAPDPIQLDPSVTRYSLTIGQFTDNLHPALGPTTLWGYDPVNPLFPGGQKHLGGLVVAKRGSPIQLGFTNNLPAKQIIPVDKSIAGAEGAPNRASVHLHGGFVPWTSDGGPFAWFAPDGTHGMSFLNAGALAGQAEYYYPMEQSARMLWYHDHAMGTTRINAYGGIATALLLRDLPEANLRNAGLPDFIENGGRELPIVVQDKSFVPSNIATVDPGWLTAGVPATPGSLWYAHVYDPALYGKLGPAPLGPIPDPNASIVPEFFGDTMLANGTVFPEVTVEARRYRLRILNACNARFLNLQMYVDDGSPNGITLNNKGNPINIAARNGAASNAQGPTSNFLVLGTEGGFLPKPALVPSNVPFN